MAEPKSDLDRSLDEVRREVIESRNLVIKTDNLLKNLHAELKAVSKRQEDFQKRQWISSAAAYLAFAALAAVGATAITSARTQAAQAERERLERQLSEVTEKSEKQRAEVQAAQAAERAAAEVYRLLTSGTTDERFKGIDALAKLDQAKTAPFVWRVLEDRAQLLRKEVSSAALERGRSAFRRQEWERAADELKRVVAVNPADEDALEASYFLGNALLQLKKSEEAIAHLQRFIDGDKKSKIRDFAMLLLVQALDAVGQKDKAVEVAREALGTYPGTEFGQAFRNRLNRRSEGPSGTGPSGGTGTGTQGGGATGGGTSGGATGGGTSSGAAGTGTPAGATGGTGTGATGGSGPSRTGTGGSPGTAAPAPGTGTGTGQQGPRR